MQLDSVLFVRAKNYRFFIIKNRKREINILIREYGLRDQLMKSEKCTYIFNFLSIRISLIFLHFSFKAS